MATHLMQHISMKLGGMKLACGADIFIKNVWSKTHTFFTNEVTCVNCKRTKYFVKRYSNECF